MNAQTTIALPMSIDAPASAVPTASTKVSASASAPVLTAAGAEARGAAVGAVAERACGRIAPLWPLRSFVAVNPFLGLTGERFEAACARMKRVAGAEMLMPRAHFRAALAEGRLTEADLAAALAAAREAAGQDAAALAALPADTAALLRALAEDRPSAPVAASTGASTVAEVLDRTRGTATAALAVEEISKWCAAYWDEGQATWRMPWHGLRPYAAWRAAARCDLTPEAAGLRGFRAAIDALPEDPLATVDAVLARLGLDPDRAEPYLHRALAGIGGWAGYARHLAWDAGLAGGADDAPLQLLAIRLAWDGALHALHPDEGFRLAWAGAARGMAAGVGEVRPSADLALDAVLQDAAERAFQRGLAAKLGAATVAAPASAPAAGAQRPAVQAAFCIDVRSEVYRRALETAAPEVDTVGFAGFFGFPIEYVPLGQDRGDAQCPVLLAPKFVLREAVAGATGAEEAAILGRRYLRGRVAAAWRSFKTSAVSSFAYVETAGLLFGAKLLGDGLGLTRPVPRPAEVGLDAGVPARLVPDLSPGHVCGRPAGIPLADRIATAEGALRGMSMTGGFARLVLLAGHGSTTVNNPHAAGLDCGACGGHAGESNARVAAAVLNDPAVRDGLRGRGIDVPEDTWFVGALHDTTTDEVTLYDLDRVPAGHADDVARLREKLRAASALARAERAALLGVAPGPRLDAEVAARAGDWSQVRPEWGLAGNAAFVAAPRGRTRGLDLGGRAFLHSYDWRKDEGFGVLELIMTAPMVVASWINLQYYGSTVDNRTFGSGNKVLHNVVGTLGVLQGNGGDLRTGLPWQSVHDGRRLVHEPLRLSVLIEAPEAAIDGVLARHPGVRDLVDNGWVHLFRINEDGALRRRAGALGWRDA
jgi:uncharacterized protein YbcC (UPF0753/DUF2309 family)